MVKLNGLKTFCDGLKDNTEYRKFHKYLLNNSEWIEVESLMSTLKPFAIATKNLQSPTTTLSDYYGMWFNLKLKMERQSRISLLAEHLFTELKAFEYTVDTPIMHAALYMDPRYNILLTEEQKIKAIDLLESFYHRIEPTNNNHSTPDREDESSLDELSIFISRIRSQAPVAANMNTDERSHSDIKRLLLEFDDQTDLTKSVLTFWEENKFTKPELYKLANIIFSIPPTQSSVERTFSALALILTPLRTQLSDKVLSEILVIRLNKPIYLLAISE